MRTSNRIVVGLTCAAMITCGDLDTFSITETSTTVVSGNPLPVQLGLLDFAGFNDMDITTNAELENQGVEASDIDSVRLTRVQLTVTSPAGDDFGFVDTMEFFAEAPGVERKRVASGGPFAAGLTTVQLALDDVDLKPYVAAESMSITTEATGRAPAEDTTIEAAIDLDVDVNVDGVLCGG